MKNTIKIFGIIVLAMVIGFPLTANPNATTITITGIPSEHNGRQAWIIVDDPANDGWNSGTITNGRITLSMLDWKDDKPYSITGNRRVDLMIFVNLEAARAGNTSFKGLIRSRNIQDNTTIAFSEFELFPN